MQTAVMVPHDQQIEMFESFSEIVRGLARLVSLGDPNAMAVIDRRMGKGMVVRMTFAVGSAGPLGILFQGALPDGSVVDLLTIDAPPSKTPFRFIP